jgi:hypothetical protein
MAGVAEAELLLEQMCLVAAAADKWGVGLYPLAVIQI